MRERKKEAQDFRNQLQAESDMILYRYLFDPIYRCYTQHSLQKQAEYEKQLPYSVLERTPNYRSRVQEAEDWNRREIEMHGERMRVVANRANPVQEAAAEAERIRKEAEEKEAKRLKEKADRKAARKAEKKERKEKEQEREGKKAKKAEKKEKGKK